MSYIFQAKTHEGHTFKVLIELLQHIIKSACFRVTREGIFLRDFDTQGKILIDLKLDCQEFNRFELEEDNINLALNLSQFYKRLKSIKKNDSIFFFITVDNPTTLQFYTQPHNSNRQSRSDVEIQNMQSVTAPLPGPYKNHIIIPSGTFQTALKGMTNINSTVKLCMKRYSFILYCVSNNISGCDEGFGEVNDPTSVEYEETFDMEVFTRILKMSGLCKSLYFQHGSINLPLHIRTRVGQLGTLSLYLKSIRQQPTDE